MNTKKDKSGKVSAASTKVKVKSRRKSSAQEPATPSGDTSLHMSISPTLSVPTERPVGIEPDKLVVKPRLVASGHKRTQQRGRKRLLRTEQEGWGIFNVEASYLISDFFRRKTDVINQLEHDHKQPWNVIKSQGDFIPVRVKITINEDDLRHVKSMMS